jgi:hypothetical protein
MSMSAEVTGEKRVTIAAPVTSKMVIRFVCLDEEIETF